MCIAAAIVGGSVAGGVISAKGAGKAAKAQQAASADASAYQERIAAADRAQQQAQYEQTRTDFAPFRDLGYQGVNNLGRLASGDMSQFFTSPDYNFRRSEGQRDLGNSFAARGGAFSGNALKALNELNSNLASGEYGNYWDRQAGLVNAGQGGTAQTAAAGANAANAITGINQNLSSGVSRNTLAAGDARASGIAGRYNAIGDTVGTIAGYGASYLANRPPKRNALYGNPYAMNGRSGPPM